MIRKITNYIIKVLSYIKRHHHNRREEFKLIADAIKKLPNVKRTQEELGSFIIETYRGEINQTRMKANESFFCYKKRKAIII